MVGAVTPLFNQPNLTLGIACGKADALPQIFFGDGMGARAGYEKPFRFQ